MIVYIFLPFFKIISNFFLLIWLANWFVGVNKQLMNAILGLQILRLSEL